MSNKPAIALASNKNMFALYEVLPGMLAGFLVYGIAQIFNKKRYSNL